MDRSEPDRERGVLAAVAVSGILYAAMAFVPQVDGPPVETASADEIRTFLAAHDTGLRVLAVAMGLSIPLVLVYTAALARLIRARRPGSVLADLVVGGGVLVAVWHWLVIAATGTTLVQSLDGTDLATVDDATLRGWYGFGNVTHVFADLGMLPICVVMGSASIAALRSGILPRFTGWLGIALAAGGVAGTVGTSVAWQPLANAWFIGIFGWWIWIAVVAVTCGLRARRARPVTASGPATVSAS